jgi:O6-methylguanine-DNA--protein-cysteine methyltransferase
METHRHGPETNEQRGWKRDDHLFKIACAQLDDYFAGRRTTFDLAVDRDGLGGTPFQRLSVA